MGRPRKNAAKAQDSLLTSDTVVEIPVDEQPYPLPEGWRWVRLLSVFSNHTDSKKKLPQKEYLSTGTLPVVDQGKEIIGGYTENKALLYSGPLPVIIFGDHTRCVKFIDFPFVQGADGVKILHAKNIITHKFFYYALKNLDMPHLGYRRHFPLFNKFMVSLPPLDEQQRIVVRIESLFAKLDEAKAKAEVVLDGFEIRKAAILHKAFTGELTAKWREENGVENDSWKEKDFAYIIRNIKAGKNLRCEERPPQGNEIGIVKVSAVTWGFFNEFESKTCIDSSVYNKNIQIKKGDFLFSRANTIQLVGNCVLVENIHKKLILSDKILRLEINKNISNKYILYFSMSTKYRKQITSLASGNQDGMRNISQKNLLKIKIPLPTEEEQQELVRILDNLLTKEQQANEAAETVLNQIDLMKKAILAKAFRGELTR